LVVEGRDDRLFCERFLDRGACKVVVAEDKGKVTDVIHLLEEARFAGVLGLVDADFDRIEQRAPESPNVLVGESHDLEGMLLNSSALDALLVEFGSRDKIDRFGRDVRETLLSNAFPIGCLRLHSKRARRDLRFDGLDYSSCVDRDTLRIDRHRLVQEIKNRSQRQDIDDSSLERGLSEVEGEHLEAYEVCVGEDLLGLLSLGLRHALGTNDSTRVGRPELLQALRLAYSDAEFARSGLRNMIERWEQANSPFRVLR
jgi:hypothetical protein